MEDDGPVIKSDAIDDWGPMILNRSIDDELAEKATSDDRRRIVQLDAARARAEAQLLRHETWATKVQGEKTDIQRQVEEIRRLTAALSSQMDSQMIPLRAETTINEDPAPLIDKLSKINEGSMDLALQAVQLSAKSGILTDEPFTPRMGKAMMAALEPTEKRLLKTLSRYACHKDWSVAQYLIPAFRSTLLHFLMGFIFVPFVPGLGPEDNRPIERLYRRICATSQDHASHWRATTYSCCYPRRDDNLIAATCAEQALEAFYKMVRCTLSRQRTDSQESLGFLAPLRPAAEGLVRSAITLQDQLRKEFFSHECYPIFTADGLFDDWSMVNVDESHHKVSSKTNLGVIIGVELGLQAAKNVVESGTMKRGLAIIRKARVLAVETQKVGDES